MIIGSRFPDVFWSLRDNPGSAVAGACMQSDYSIYILLTQSMNLAKMCLRREYLRIRVGLRNEMEAQLTNLSEVRSTT